MKLPRVLLSVLLGLTLLVQGAAWAAPMGSFQKAEITSAEVMPCHAHQAIKQTKADCSLCGMQGNCAAACTAALAVLPDFTHLTLVIQGHDFHPALLDAQATSPHTLDTLRPPIVSPS